MDTMFTGNLFPTCINSLYRTKSFSPELEYNTHTQALREGTFSPNSDPLYFKAAGALLKDSSCSYKFEFSKFKCWSQLGGYVTGQNRP